MKRSLRYFTHVILVVLVSASLAKADLPSWTYDAGPDLKTKMGRELNRIIESIPSFPYVSDQVIGTKRDAGGKQKFRPAFGPIPYRMLLKPNSVKILFIGQDGTHIAEAAGRPATAGFGGRAQDLAKYFGVREGAAFINTYAFTIKGQYGVYNTPFFVKSGSGYKVSRSGLVSNSLWAITQDLKSPITKWRNKLIDWIIRNNKNSLRMVVLFGGSSRDAIASYIISKGGKVKAKAESKMSKVQVAEIREAYAGGNNTYPVLINRKGKDLYAEKLGRKLNYKPSSKNERESKDAKAAWAAIKADPNWFAQRAVLTKGGPYKNGLLNAAQLGGYDLGKITVKGKNTRSIKGIKLNDGSTLKNDVIVLTLPHPSSLSKGSPASASKAVMGKLNVLKSSEKKVLARIKADPGQTNYFAKGEKYQYRRADIGPEFYDFGTPRCRMVSKSSAQRLVSNVVMFGTRDRPAFSNQGKRLQAMTNAKPAPGLNPRYLYISQKPVDEKDPESFDSGPGKDMAELMKRNLDLNKVAKTKATTTDIKSVGDFGHYRGTFNRPRVLILADPIGYDDLATARALTGERGQYIQGLMNDMGVRDDYLVIKTVPFGMDGKGDKEWKKVLKVTRNYRDAVLNEVLKRGTPDLIITDGRYAKAAALAESALKGTKIPMVHMKRTDKDNKCNYDHRTDMLNAAKDINELDVVRSFDASAKMANIPRTHLSYYARMWEGTSGDRVIMSNVSKYKGKAFAVVVPSWAYKQKYKSSQDVKDDIKALVDLLIKNGFPKPNESIPTYLERRYDKEASLTIFIKEIMAA